MKSAIHTTACALGVYAGLLGIEHGIFEILQGDRAPTGLLINAIGPPCQPGMVWHACFPALAVIPNFIVTGMLAILTGLSISIWASRFVHREKGATVLLLLSVLLLPVGGGFIPVFIGVLAGITGNRINAPQKWTWAVSRNWSKLVATAWPWALGLLVAWFPGSWVCGYFFNRVMLEYGTFLFLFFDIGLPVFIVFSGFLQDSRYREVGRLRAV